MYDFDVVVGYFELNLNLKKVHQIHHIILRFTIYSLPLAVFPFPDFHMSSIVLLANATNLLKTACWV